MDSGGELMRRDWSRLGLPFLASFLLLIAAAKLWKAPNGDFFAACLLGASLVLLGISANDWAHRDKEEK